CVPAFAPGPAALDKTDVTLTYGLSGLVCPLRVMTIWAASGIGVRSARPATLNRNAPLRWLMVLFITQSLSCLPAKESLTTRESVPESELVHHQNRHKGQTPPSRDAKVGGSRAPR